MRSLNKKKHENYKKREKIERERKKRILMQKVKDIK